MSVGLRRLFALTLCMTLAACTTLRDVPQWQPPAESSQPTLSTDLRPGDRITVTTTDGQKVEMVFVGLTADVLEGTVGKDERVVQVPRAQISHVERREYSAFKTTGLVVSVVLVALITVLAIGLSTGGSMPSGGPRL